MDIRFIFSLVTTLFIATPALSGEGMVDLSTLTCDVPACNRVAKKRDYKADRLDHAILLKIGRFSLSVLDEPLSKMVSSEDEVMLFYKNGQRLLFAMDSGPDVGELKSLSASQFPLILFTKTTHDEEPEADTDQFLWKVALYQKAAFFNHAKEISFMENDGTSYFLSDSGELGFSGSAMVSMNGIDDVFLRIKAMNVDFDKFRKIVTSVVVE